MREIKIEELKEVVGGTEQLADFVSDQVQRKNRDQDLPPEAGEALEAAPADGPPEDGKGEI